MNMAVIIYDRLLAHQARTDKYTCKYMYSDWAVFAEDNDNNRGQKKPC